MENKSSGEIAGAAGGKDDRPRRRAVRSGAVRNQKVSIDHGTPGGALGVPDEEERRRDPGEEAERGDRRDAAD